MAAAKENQSFGRYLQAIRLEKGIGLAAISKQTRIGVEILQHIEREELKHLPAEVFVKGFVRSYARILGVDADQAVHRYVVALDQCRQLQASEKAIARDQSHFWWRLVGAMLLLIMIVGVTLVAVRMLTTEPPSVGLAPSESKTDAAPPTPPEKSAIKMPSLPSVPKPPVVQLAAPKYQLAVEGLRETHIKVIVDDQSPEEYTLHEGDRLVLEANRGFNLLVDNATGVRISLNGKPMVLKGKDGQMVTRQLP